MSNNRIEDEIDIIEFIGQLWQKRLFIALFVMISSIGAILYSIFAMPIYKVEATILPLGSSSAGVNLGGLGALVGMMGGSGGSSGSKDFLALLETRKIAESIVEQYQLENILIPLKDDMKKISDEQSVFLASDILKNLMTFTNDLKKDTIVISVEYKDLDLAHKLVTWYIDALQNAINTYSLSIDKNSRVFIQKQLKYNQIALLELGKELSSFYQSSVVSTTKSTLDVPIVMDVNPLESSDKRIVHTVKDVPQQIYLQYLTVKKNLMQEINGLLMNRYEIAKIEESKDELSFTVIDPPQKPLYPFKPNKKLIVLVTFASSFVMAIFIVFFFNYIRSMRSVLHEKMNKVQ